MRILQVIPFFYPAWAYGGPVRSVYEISRRLVLRGHEVTVVTTDVLDRSSRFHGPKGVGVDVEGIRTYYFRNVSNALAYQWNAYLAPGMLWKLPRVVAGVDVVHLHDYYTLQNVLSWYWCRRLGVPYLFSARGSLLPSPERGMMLPKKLFIRLFGRQVVQDARFCVAISEGERRQYVETGVDSARVVVVTNAVDVADYRDLPARGCLRSRLGLSRSDQIVLFLGRIHHVKGVDILIQAFSLLESALPGARLVIAGPDAGFRSQAQSLAQSLGVAWKVHFPGTLLGLEKMQAYVDADVAVLPSRSEGFSLAAVEASAAGRPVVISRNCPLPELVQWSAGLIADDGPEALAAALRKVLTNPQLAENMGRNGRRMVESQFRWDKTIDRLECLYAAAVGCESPVHADAGE